MCIHAHIFTQARNAAHLPPPTVARLLAMLPLLAACPATHSAVCQLAGPLAHGASMKVHSMQQQQVRAEDVCV